MEGRVQKIYYPKAKFLKEVIGDKVNPKTLKVLDLGAGSGYFLKALQQNGFFNVIGHDVSSNQVK
ncbi:methyltransferase domain-containing protein [Lysinibacillus sp. RC79]|uniref:methyltransferase domain-containing protein n=1 Tax=Lysinibacillus sp. RC79 TaxID=3156296 RepID=UPI003513F314